MLRTTSLGYQYPGGAPLPLPELDVPQGGALVLRGNSGSGKSTLLALAAGLLTATSGAIEVAGQNPALLKPAKRDAWRFRGLEASGNWRLLNQGSTLDMQWRFDTVRAVNSNTGASLPRIAPVRLGATLVWALGSWGARGGFDHYAKPSDNTTTAYTLWNAAVTYRMKAQNANLLWFARLENASDKLAYSATSILTQSAPGKSPLPGRSLKLGLQATF